METIARLATIWKHLEDLATNQFEADIDMTVEHPRRATCVEYFRMLTGGTTKPLLVGAIDDEEARHELVLKFRHPDSREGHYGGTSLACELICSVLGRAIGLTVPDYFIVDVPRELPDCINDAKLQELFTRNTGCNFGSRFHHGMSLWDGRRLEGRRSFIRKLEDVLAFDATVINGDRKADKSNLLWRGKEIMLIDHSLAIPVHQWEQDLIVSSPLFPAGEIREHCSFRSVAGKHRQFMDLLDAWRERITADDLACIRDMIPVGWETSQGDLSRIFSFLTGRAGRIDAISSDLRRIAG